MPNKPKIYIETTLFNHYFDKNRATHADTVTLFKQIAAGKYEAYTSQYVVEELEKALEPKRSQMLALIPKLGIQLVDSNDEAARLAAIYIAERIIPRTYFTDAIQIAIATVHDLPMIASANFKHIVKSKTKLATGKINALNGHHPVAIVSPKEIV